MQRIRTERLVLRKFRESDLEDFHHYCRMPNVGPSAGWKPHEDLSESHGILKLFLEKDEVYAIVLEDEGHVIGSIGIHADSKRSNDKCRMIGYVLSENYWGRGIAAEATRAVIAHLFTDTDLQLISIYHYDFNQQSKRVIEKCGFNFEGVLRKATKRYDGQIFDDWCYALSKEDWLKRTQN